MNIVYADNYDNLIITQISQQCGILKDTARLLLARNIDTVEKAKKFLGAGKKYFYSPFLFKKMQEVVERIEIAKNNNEKILIFGDYDADGICATTILYNCLKIYGVEALYVVPEREEGYSLNIDVIDNFRVNDGVSLVITVDCGISDYDKIETIKKSGVDVIVTDHHEPPQVVPNCLVINPKILDSGYPFASLSGAGVAYKLGYALIGDKADEYLDFVALATVADSMDLIDENRDLVVEGLKILNGNKVKEPFKYLVTDISKKITSQTLAFQIAPRINAGGRMGDAKSSLRLFISQDKNEIYDLAVKLNEYNIQRQAECDRIYREAKEKLAKEQGEQNAIVLYDVNWQTGFVGIVASRLVEEFNKPTIVFGGVKDGLKGSARSIEGINIFDALCSASEFAREFGGHAQAAGVGVDKDKFEQFKGKINNFVRENGSVQGQKIYRAEWQIENPVSLQFAKEIELLEPFGVGNKKPIFNVVVYENKIKYLNTTGLHYTFNTPNVSMIAFNGQDVEYLIKSPIKKNILFEVGVSVYNKKESLKGYVKKVVVDTDDKLSEVFEFERLLWDILNGKKALSELSKETLLSYSYLKDLSLDRQVFVEIFTAVKTWCDREFSTLLSQCQNCDLAEAFQYVFSAIVFFDLGFFYIENGYLKLDKNARKNLTESKIYQHIGEIRG